MAKETIILERGMEELGKDFERIAKKAIDQTVHKKVLNAGAKPIIKRARNTMRRYSRTGTLVRNIGYVYDKKLGRTRLGWKGKKSFYGFFWEVGYNPMITDNRRAAREGRILDSLHTRRNSASTRWGRRMQRPHLFPARDAERENALRIMEELLQKEFGG